MRYAIGIVVRGDPVGNGLDFGQRILDGDPDTAGAHHLDIVDVIADGNYIIHVQPARPEQMTQRLSLVGSTGA